MEETYISEESDISLAPELTLRRCLYCATSASVTLYSCGGGSHRGLGSGAREVVQTYQLLGKTDKFNA